MLICAKVEDAFDRVLPQIHPCIEFWPRTTSKFQIDMRRSYRGYWEMNFAASDRVEAVLFKQTPFYSDNVTK